MAQFILIKLSRAFLTLLLAVTFVFVVLRLSGDPVSMMLPDDTPPEIVAEYRAAWGLDRSLPEQYVRFIWSALHGDLGYSFRDDRPAVAVVVERVPMTLLLGLSSFAITVVVGLLAGIAAALKRGTSVDRVVMAFSIFGHSIPNFFLAILMIMLFSMSWRLLPSSGGTTWWHLVLPAVTLGIINAGTVARFTRSSMLEVLHQPYMRTARAKGLRLTRRIMSHAIPNAAIPIVTVLGLRLGGLIAGSVVIETVYAWPGIGLMLVNAVSQRDLPVVQTIVLLVALTMVVTNFIVDITYGWLDPRIENRRSKEA
ncbi:MULTISPECIES: ABC transporter permease [Rhizobium/Agrobacterium group]|uniref:Agrocinopine A and B ABC transporter, membrane spanning protein n=3 Tax=Rhizobium/Agrobacterium group TaxID=227290 RepID=A0A4P8DKE0_RHIRH|nr:MULTISPECIES: ABC transporter permease [Rhizobium/Agrobacterium group]MCM2436052.1 ABC transporter permease [Agrobacterium rosae]MUO42950.1 ABC transporter permease subunit [Agrobacterium vitis]QCL10810.1 agrocinopine A and B ABC transporter, membrane spanning protein [Rhizobium rhizogenes]QCL98459.1 ABC transporter permease [Agrobacterium tumefaciens]